MVFWLGVLFAMVFAWFAFKIGFYETWALVFNIVVSVYLAIFAGPVILELVPAAGDTPYATILAMISTAVVAFLILEAISYSLITGRVGVTFPKVLDALGGPALGFAGGFLVWSFICLLICISPICGNKVIKAIGFGDEARQTTISNICWWCNAVHRFVAFEDAERTAEKEIDALLRTAEPEKQKDTEPPADSNEPNTANVAAMTDGQYVCGRMQAGEGPG
jgi:hypothetical protein